MSEWQPIETAPKDGEYVIVSYGAGFVTQACYTTAIDASNGNWEDREGWFVYIADDAVYSDSFLESPVQPKHWMPLPKPPVLDNE